MGLDPVRISRLKLIARSPLHYAYATVEETLAMERGSAVHSLVLGGQPVIAWRKVSDAGNPCPRRGKDYDAFEADNPGALILTADAFDEAACIADAIKSHNLAMGVLEGEHEIEKAWRFGKRACAGRLDNLAPTHVADLKITQSSEPTKVMWQALRMGWFAQLPWYLDGVLASGTGTPEAAYIVAVEPKAPYAVSVLRFSDRAIEQGRRTYRSWLERLLVCEDTDEWPAYAQSIVELDVPDNDVALDFGEAEAA